MSQDKPRPLVRAVELAELAEESYSHPMNPRSQIHGRPLSDLSGLKKVGVWMVRVPPGKESFVKHVHHVEEEWMYVLSGRGVLELGEETHAIGPGDFVGHAPGGAPHLVRNESGEDLVYLSGGDRSASEIADMPAEGKRMVRVGEKVVIYPLDAGGDFPPYRKL